MTEHFSFDKVVDDERLRSRRYVFKDRIHAGELLAKKLWKYKGEDAIVLAIPAGGVPVGYRIAVDLQLPLDLIVVRKLPIPYSPEAGFGALTTDGTVVLNEPLVGELGLTKEEIDMYASARMREVKERLRKFRGDRPFTDLKEKIAIIVDDGLASGYTMTAAILSVRKQLPRRIVVAVPTAHLGALEKISAYADEIICLNIRSGFLFAVADAYLKWYDLDDSEVIDYLKNAWQ
jgi:predicted phosphoribosyltransferase